MGVFNTKFGIYTQTQKKMLLHSSKILGRWGAETTAWLEQDTCHRVM
jgi:hypothetical protein